MDESLAAFYTEDTDHELAPKQIMVVRGNLAGGIEYPQIRFAILTESDIFGREKGKKEEMPPAAATRASRVRGESPSWEQVKERAEVSLKCRDFDWLREWFAEQECSAWHDGNGNPMRNWGRALAIAWRYREVDAARRDPERRFADARAGETEIAGDLIAKQMAELGKAVH
jgi:hypothetical protein